MANLGVGRRPTVSQPRIEEGEKVEMKTPELNGSKGEMTISRPSADIFTTPTFFHTPVRRQKGFGIGVGLEWNGTLSPDLAVLFEKERKAHYTATR